MGMRRNLVRHAKRVIVIDTHAIVAGCLQQRPRIVMGAMVVLAMSKMLHATTNAFMYWHSVAFGRVYSRCRPRIRQIVRYRGL
jgi:hypothetical protein